jgi:hypothetical protein
LLCSGEGKGDDIGNELVALPSWMRAFVRIPQVYAWRVKLKLGPNGIANVYYGHAVSSAHGFVHLGGEIVAGRVESTEENHVEKGCSFGQRTSSSRFAFSFLVKLKNMPNQKFSCTPLHAAVLGAPLRR